MFKQHRLVGVSSKPQSKNSMNYVVKLLLSFGALLGMAWFSSAVAHTLTSIEAHADDLDGIEPFLRVNSCEVRENPAFWEHPKMKSAIDAVHKQRATSNPRNQLKSANAYLREGAVRKDAAGNIILRLALIVSEAGAAKYGGLPYLESDFIASMADATRLFQASGVKITLEHAGSWLVTNVPMDQFNDDRLGTVIFTPSSVSVLGKPGQLESYLEFRDRTNFNVWVTIDGGADGSATALPQTWTYSGRTEGMVGGFRGTPSRVSSGFGSRWGMTATTIVHELGHVMGQSHGVATDLPASETEYRLRTNYPYGMGFEMVPNPTEKSVGVATMMAYNRSGVTSLAWLRATTGRFSDPGATATVSGVTLPLGRSGLEDSVRALNNDRFNFAMGTTPNLKAWKISVIEYYHAGLNQYFSTARADDIALLDSLGFEVTGFVRTGNNYDAVSLWGDPTDVLVNPSDAETLGLVHRFYGDPAGPNTHFYSGVDRTRSGIASTYDNNDVDLLKTLQWKNANTPKKLHYEGMEYRVSMLYDAANPDISKRVSCAPSWTPVYRLYNGEDGTKLRANGTRIDGNHRYATTQAIRDQMKAQGWVDEGIAWCIPQLR